MTWPRTLAILALAVLFAGCGTGGGPVRGMVVPIMHQDIGYTGGAQETLAKMVRCLETIVPKLEEIPEATFWWENAYPLKLALDKRPDLAPRIAALLKSGRFGLGAEWGPMDATLVPGESLVRTVTLAKHWARRALDYEPRVASMNDMSGFPPQMAQVYKKAGVPFFFYTRGWEPPQPNYFHLVGLDGSRVLVTKVTAPMEVRLSKDAGYDVFYMFSGKTLFLEGRRDFPVTDENLKRVMANLVKHDKALDREEWPRGLFWGMLGGGGDNRIADLPRIAEMIERVNSLDMPELENVRFQFGSVDRIAGEMLQEHASKDLPGWTMYQQTWAVQNRQERTFYSLSRAEADLLAAEKLASICDMLGQGRYPAEDFEHVWADKMLWVYDHNWGGRGENRGSDFEKLRSARQAMEQAASMLDLHARNLACAVATSRENPIVVFNTLNWPRTDVAEATVELARGNYKVVDGGGRDVPCAVTRLGPGAFPGNAKYGIRFLAKEVPSFGYATFYVAAGEPGGPSVTVDKDHIENEFFKIELDAEAGIARIRDKKLGCELIRKGFGRIVSEDVDHRHMGQLDGDPAFDETAKITDTMKVIGVFTSPVGSLGAEAQIEGRIEGAPVVMTLQLWRDVPRIDLRVEMDYSGVAPRVIYMALPFDLPENWKNTIGVAFGAMDNPVLTGDNHEPSRIIPGGFSRHSASGKGYIGSGCNELTIARFAQKWACLAAPGDEWGVSVALRHNHTPVYRTPDCFYVGLLRPLTKHDGDLKKMGYHSCELTFASHGSGWREAKSYKTGWERSSDLVAVGVPAQDGSGRARFLPESGSFLETNVDNVVVTALTKSRDQQGYILRYYEAADSDGEVEIRIGEPLTLASAGEVDLLEDPAGPAQSSGNSVTVPTVGFEIKTLKLGLSRVKEQQP